MAEDTAVVETPVIDAPAAVETPAATDVTQDVTPQTSDSSDPMAALQAAMDSEFPADAPATEPEGNQAAPAAEFAPLLGISGFVREPQHVESAIRAADEVWKVASGQLPARALLEGLKSANPQQAEAIAADLREYLGVPAQSVNPLDALKQSNPQVYAAIADYYQKQTGKSLDAAADPRDARLAQIEQQFAQQEQQRQQEAWQGQVRAADEAAHAFLDEKLKGTFLEGSNDHLIGLMAQKLGKNLNQSMQEVLQGNTKSLEKVLREVQKEETARLKKYNENLIKKHRALANGVPAVKGAPVKSEPGSPAYKEGETAIQYATRLWNESAKK